MAIKIGTIIYSKFNFSLNEPGVKTTLVSQNILRINYSYNGINKQLFVPISPELKKKMKQVRVYLIKKDTAEIDITQQFGTSYYVTADQLEGEAIEYRTITDEVITTFEQHQIPFLKL